MIYLDSCALVKLIHAEVETAALREFLDSQDEELVTSELALTELPRVIRRVNHDSQRRLRVSRATLNQELATAAELLDRLGKVVIDTTLLTAAGGYDADPDLGSLDSLHLVAALELRPALTSFVTYDRALARSVTEAGLPLAQPS